jgi:hypothetical protein|tara:strand:+ start:825 stop:1022 length:198 start_codon:yes stop_codon:yes gene_type:complete
MVTVSPGKLVSEITAVLVGTLDASEAMAMLVVKTKLITRARKTATLVAVLFMDILLKTPCFDIPI